jgi:hypothetical protein
MYTDGLVNIAGIKLHREQTALREVRKWGVARAADLKTFARA